MKNATAARGPMWEMHEESRDGARAPRLQIRTQPHSPFVMRLTKRMTHVDPKLIAIARGDADPVDVNANPTAPPPAAPSDDPFGGLIPVDDDASERE